MPIVNSFDVAALQAAIINQINASSTATAAALDVQAAKLDETKAGLDSSLNGAVDSISNAVSAVGTAVNNVNDSVTSKSVIKSIQRGEVSIVGAQNILIAPVDPSKCVVNVFGQVGYSDASSYYNVKQGGTRVTGLSSDTLSLYGGVDGSYYRDGSKYTYKITDVVCWEVIEYV